MAWSEWKKFSSEYTNIEDYSKFGGNANYSITHTATDDENGTIFLIVESINGNAITLNNANVTITNGILNVLKKELIISSSIRPSYLITYVANYSIEAGGKIDVNVTYPNATYNNGVHFLVLN